MKTPSFLFLALLASALPAAAGSVPTFDAKDVTVPAKVVGEVLPDSPIRRLVSNRGDRAWAATAQVDFVVDQTGASQEIHITCPDSDLSRAVREMISRARFLPGRKDGQVVRVRMHLVESVRCSDGPFQQVKVEGHFI